MSRADSLHIVIIADETGLYGVHNVRKRQHCRGYLQDVCTDTRKCTEDRRVFRPPRQLQKALKGSSLGRAAPIGLCGERMDVVALEDLGGSWRILEIPHEEN